MQLVNIDSVQNFISNDLIEAIKSNQISKAKEILLTIDDTDVIFRSFYILSCWQKDIKDYLSAAIIYTDALIELTKRLFPDDPKKLIISSLDYYCTLEYGESKGEIESIKPDISSGSVVVSKLEEYVMKRDFTQAFQMSKNLLAVMDSKKYFNELLLNIAAKIYTDSGESIVVSNAVIKGIVFFKWQSIDDLLIFLLKFLCSPRLNSSKQTLIPSEEEIKYAEYVLRAANKPEKNGENLLFMAHARQVYRYASTIYKDIWAQLSGYIKNKLDKFPLAELDEIKPVKGDIYDFQRSLNVGQIHLSRALVNKLLQEGTTSNELFCIITLFMIESNLHSQPENLIYLNVARRLAVALDYPRNLHIFNAFLKYLFSNENENK